MSQENEQSDNANSENKTRSLFRGKLPLERETCWFILVSVLDIVMTYFLLRKRGQFQEGNPVARYYIDRWGIKGMVYFKFGMVTFISVIAQIIALKNRSAARWILVFGTLVVSGVVIYSLFLLVRSGGVQ
jgi:hypothetical protein